MKDHGLVPHSDYIQETEEGSRIIVPPNLPHWSEASLSQFAKGGLPPTTLRDHFNGIRSFVSNYVWLPDPVAYSLVSVTVVLSYLIRIFPAVPLIEVEGPVGSGKAPFSTFFRRFADRESFPRSPLSQGWREPDTSIPAPSCRRTPSGSQPSGDPRKLQTGFHTTVSRS